MRGTIELSFVDDWEAPTLLFESVHLVPGVDGATLVDRAVKALKIVLPPGDDDVYLSVDNWDTENPVGGSGVIPGVDSSRIPELKELILDTLKRAGVIAGVE